MKTTKYVIINNRAYDPVTGLPVDNVQIEGQKSETPANTTVETLRSRGIATPSVHSTTQKSMTLRRKYVRQPNQNTDRQPVKQINIRNFSPMSVSRLQTETRSLAAPEPSKATPISVSVDRKAEVHPVTQRAHARPAVKHQHIQRQRMDAIKKHDPQMMHHQINKPAASPKPAKTLKDEAIIEAMSQEMKTNQKAKRKSTKHTSKFSRFVSFAVPSLAIVMLAGYFTYLSMPNLSIKMAAVQSGINAKYPGYKPDGYALNGPITFDDGQVKMRFAYADEGHDFTLTQQKSNWSSATVKEQFSDDSNKVNTSTVDGLTIYSEGNKASWVNGGILYTIDGDATLSNNQIQRIATSL